MKYALINDNKVSNVIVLLPYNADEYPNAVNVDGRPVQAGDIYDNGKFYREGAEVYTDSEKKDITIDRMNAAGAAAMQALEAEPPKEAGVFTYSEWKAGKTYKRFEPFTHNGIAGFARLEHTAQEHQQPFAEGMSAIYGARPPRDAEGVYAYIPSMKVDIGDVVRSAKDGAAYLCYANGADPLNNDPAEVPALFNKLG